MNNNVLLFCIFFFFCLQEPIFMKIEYEGLYLKVKFLKKFYCIPFIDSYIWIFLQSNATQKHFLYIASEHESTRVSRQWRRCLRWPNGETKTKKILSELKQKSVLLPWHLGACHGTRMQDDRRQPLETVCLLPSFPCFFYFGFFRFVTRSQVLGKNEKNHTSSPAPSPV